MLLGVLGKDRDWVNELRRNNILGIDRTDITSLSKTKMQNIVNEIRNDDTLKNIAPKFAIAYIKCDLYKHPFNPISGVFEEEYLGKGYQLVVLLED